MAQHSHYWSCSRFADWLRGTPKLLAGTAEEWQDWRQSAESAHPVRYWLAEEGLGYIQDFVTWPARKIYDFKYYINNRFVTRTHGLTAHPQDIKPGTWCDVGNRFLPCLFNELVDFVEVELAWWHVLWDDEARKKYRPPFWATGWFRWRSWRCAEAGQASLEWQRNLRWKEDDGFEPGDDNIGQLTPQAQNAQEILDLYTWWTQTRPKRPDPMDASGWSEYCERRRQERGSDSSMDILMETKDEELKTFGDRALRLCREIEEQQEQEDEDMMIRLIKVRRALWT